MTEGRGKQLKEPDALTKGDAKKDLTRCDLLKKGRLCSNLTVDDDLFFKIESNHENQFPHNKSKKGMLKKVVCYSINIVGRSLSLTDLITDGIFFYHAIHSALPLTIGLFTSMIALYILSYATTLKELQSVYRVLFLLLLFPNGVFYVIFLDVLDIFLNLSRWTLLFIFGWNGIQIKQWQVGMDRIKSVAQFPHMTVQVLFYLNMIPGKELTGITDTMLLISITSASLNCMQQILRFILESKAVQQNVIQYIEDEEEESDGDDTFEDLLLLLSVCQKQRIAILDIIESKVSKKMERNAQGRPLIMVFADLKLRPARVQSRMMYRLLQYDLDVNLTDVATGESLIFSLLRSFDYSTIRYLLTRYCEGKKIKINLNYYNKNGVSPLYVALQSYNYERRIARGRHTKKRRRFMFDYLMSYGAPLNASIREKSQISPLWFAIKEIDDKQLTKTLLQRGCKLNIDEMNKLSQLYCDYAIKDNKQIYDTVMKNVKQNNDDAHSYLAQLAKRNKDEDVKQDDQDDDKEEEKSDIDKPQMMDSYAQMKAIGTMRYEFIKYRVNERNKDNEMDDADLKFAFVSNLTNLYNVIQKSNIPQAYICDENRNNPLHLYIKSAINDTTAHDMKPIITILKMECPEWLYLRNANGKTPIDLCVEARAISLFESLLFDTEKDKYLLDYKRDQSTTNEDEEDAEEETEEKEDIEEAMNETKLILNEELYHKLISHYNHIENYNMLLNWVIDVSDELLTPYLKSVSPHLLDIEDSDADITILDCDVSSKLLKHYMESTDHYKINSLNTIHMLLQCIMQSDSTTDRSPLVSLCDTQHKLYVIDVLVYHFDLQLGQQDQFMLQSYSKQCKAARANEKDAILRILNKQFKKKKKETDEETDEQTDLKEDEKDDIKDDHQDEADVNDEEAKKQDTAEKEDADHDDDAETKEDAMDGEEDERPDESDPDEDKETELQVVSVIDELLDPDAADKETIEEEETASSWVELIYSTFVESLSMADFITDFLVLKQLFEGGHQWWSSWMVLMMLSSYLVSFSVVGTLFVNAVSAFVQDRQLNKQSGCTCRYVLFVLMAILLMTPLNVLYFFIVDCVFMVYVLVSAMIYFVTCSHVDITDWIDDYVFQKLLGMNRMQIIGYRRLRTLSQLLFETIPQLLLQIHMLRVSNLDGLDAESLIVSILFALLHMLFEGIIIYSDSKACDSSVLEYGLQCLHARMNWIPYTGVFETRLKEQIKAIESHQTVDDDYTEDKTKYYYQFNYEKLITNVCGLKYKLEFKFSNESMAILSENLISLPIPNVTKDSSNVDNPMLRLILSFKNREDVMVHIEFGNDCCRNINLSSFCDAYRNGYKKVIFNTNAIDWQRMMKRKTDAHANTNSNAQLLVLLNELAMYVELDAVNELLRSQPSLDAAQRTKDIKSTILKLINEYNSDCLFILKQYSEKGVHFGYNCSEAEIVYDAIYNVLLNNALNDPSYCYVVLFYLWYTQHSLYNHKCLNGCCNLMDSLAAHNNNEVNELIHNLLHDDYVP
eukprot:116652_1